MLKYEQLRELLEVCVGAKTLQFPGTRKSFEAGVAAASKTVTSGNSLLRWWDMQTGIDEGPTDPFQIALKALEEGNMISPTGGFRGNWDMVQAALLIYIAISLPYRLGFDDNTVVGSFWFCFDVGLDIYFLIDLFLNFRTAIITEEGHILYTPKEIAHSYLRGK